MNKTCKLLKKSFYEDKWTWDCTYVGTTLWVREKDGLSLVSDYNKQVLHGYKTNIIIPWYLVKIMSWHIKRGQNIIATKELLDEPQRKV